ncbi:MAG: hypothetical protein K5776_10430 [Lachnospiraceae bacterium]|nr:hypothetical protein [Lachnospiraceae bacterium]
MKEKKVKFQKIFSLSVVLCLTLSLFGCNKLEENKEAKQNVSKHKAEFAQAVENEFGSNYVLSDVKGVVHYTTSDYSLLGEYEAFPEIKGTLDNNGNKYNATYNFSTQTLTTDVYSEEILDSVIERLGLDESKVVYSAGIDIVADRYRDSDYDHFECTSDVHTISEAMGKPGRLEFYIVTTEDIDDLSFEGYKILCKNVDKVWDVQIFSSDDPVELEHFKKHFKEIEYSLNSLTVPETDDINSPYVDAFAKYDLKGYARIRKSEYKQEETNVVVDRISGK